MSADRQDRRARSRRSASTTGPSSGRARLWPLYEKFLRSAAGLGKLDAHAGHSAATTSSIGERASSSSAAARRAAPRRSRPRRSGPASCSSTRTRGAATCGSRASRCSRRPARSASGRAASSRSTRDGSLPLPRGADRRRDRRDRAAARLPGERPRRRDAPGRGTAAWFATSRSSRASARSCSASDDDDARDRRRATRGRHRCPRVVDLRDARPRGSPRRVARVASGGSSLDDEASTATWSSLPAGRQPAYSLLAQAGARIEFDDAARRLRPDGAPAGVEAVGASPARGSARSRRAGVPRHEGSASSASART